ILDEPNQVVRRFFALDTQAYKAGALDVPTKELLGLVASLVLRCDDCIAYHVGKCREAGVARDAMFEAFSIGLVVGGSIVIPHRRGLAGPARGRGRRAARAPARPPGAPGRPPAGRPRPLAGKRGGWTTPLPALPGSRGPALA